MGNLGDRDRSQILIREAISLAEEFGDECMLGVAKMYLTWQYPRGERATILSEVAEYYPRVESALDLESVLWAFATETPYTGGEVTESLRLAEESVALAEQLGNDYTLNGKLAVMAMWDFMVGQVEDARRVARPALMLYRHQGRSLFDTVDTLRTLAWCATDDGDFEDGAQLIAVFDHLVEDLPDEIRVTV